MNTNLMVEHRRDVILESSSKARKKQGVKRGNVLNEYKESKRTCKIVFSLYFSLSHSFSFTHTHSRRPECDEQISSASLIPTKCVCVLPEAFGDLECDGRRQRRGGEGRRRGGWMMAECVTD